MKRTIGRKKKQPFISLHSDSVFPCSDVSCEVYIYRGFEYIIYRRKFRSQTSDNMER